jgi:hypothetical protein
VVLTHGTQSIHRNRTHDSVRLCSLSLRQRLDLLRALWVGIARNVVCSWSEVFGFKAWAVLHEKYSWGQNRRLHLLLLAHSTLENWHQDLPKGLAVLAIMGMPRVFLCTKIVHNYYIWFENASSKGCKKKEHDVVELSSTKLSRAPCSFNIGKPPVTENRRLWWQANYAAPWLPSKQIQSLNEPNQEVIKHNNILENNICSSVRHEFSIHAWYRDNKYLAA